MNNPCCSRQNCMHRFSILFAFLVVFFTVRGSASGASLLLTLENTTQVSQTTFVFDICLQNNDVSSVEYAMGQFAILCDPAIGGGLLTMTSLSSDLPVSMQPRNPVVNAAFTSGAVTVTKFEWASNAVPHNGNGYILSPGQKIKVLSVQISGAVALNSVPANLTWYTGSQDLATKVNTYIRNKNTNITSGSVLSADTRNPVLPVELKSFSVSQQSGNARDVELKWLTASEHNVNHFEVERSRMDVAVTHAVWETVGKQTAAGNSNTVHEYSFLDKNLNAGAYHYRLKVVDNDGSEAYSEQLGFAEIMNPRNFGLSQNYPNPFNPSTKIDYQLPAAAKVTIELYNIRGQRVLTLLNDQMDAGYHTFVFNPATSAVNLSSGMYVYRLFAQGKDSKDQFLSVKKMLYLK